LTKNPLIYSVSYFNFGVCSFLGGLSPPKPPWRRDWLPTDVYFENWYYQTMLPVTHRPFGCSAVIRTSYVRRLLQCTTLFSAAIAKLQWRSQPKNFGGAKCLILDE